MLVERRGVIGHDQQLQYLADDRMLSGDANAVLDTGIGGSNILDLDGIDLVTAHVDHVSGTAGEMDHAFLIEITEI